MPTTILRPTWCGNRLFVGRLYAGHVWKVGSEWQAWLNCSDNGGHAVYPNKPTREEAQTLLVREVYTAG